MNFIRQTSPGIVGTNITSLYSSYRAYYNREYMKVERKKPEVIIKDGRPAAVIINIDEYQEMVERLGDAELLLMIKKIRGNPPEFDKSS